MGIQVSSGVVHFLRRAYMVLSVLAAAVPSYGNPLSHLDLLGGRELDLEVVVQTGDNFFESGGAKEDAAPFSLAEWDYNTCFPDEKYQYPCPFATEFLPLLIPRGEYGMAGFLLRAGKDLHGLSLKAEPLRAGNGETIGPDHIRLARVAKARDYTSKHTGVSFLDVLVDPAMPLVPKNGLVGFLVLVNVPADAPHGVYRSSVTIDSAEGRRVLPVQLRVPDFVIPDADIPIGYYLPFYTHDQGKGEGARWAIEGYTAERQKRYFQFMAERGMNSPAIYHVNPEFMGKDCLEMDFGSTDRLVDHIVSAGGCKAIVFDLRRYCWHARRLAKLSRYQKAGMDDIHIFRNLVKQFRSHAEAKHYPRFLLFCEEEMSGHVKKQPDFLRFGEALREVAGEERTILLDNPDVVAQNAGRDFGHRFKYLHRQYNTRTDLSLRRAMEDGAEIWSFNYSYRRPFFGLLLHRLHSRGHHQWADLWKSYGNIWTVTVPTDRGVISSLKCEMAHEGIVDYRCLLALKGGQEELLARLVAELPVERDRASWHLVEAPLTVEKNNLIRWRAILAASGESSLQSTAPGIPEFATSSIRSEAGKQSMVLEARRVPDSRRRPSVEDSSRLGRGPDCTGALRYMAEQERHIRAEVSSEEEFQKRLPSSGMVWVSYNASGIFLSAVVCHTRYRVSRYADNDSELWKDNCMEYFFLLPDNHSWHLIVNSSDAKTLLKDDVPADASSVCSVSKPIEGRKNGYVQEVLIPWAVFGLRKMPQTGTAWAFNAGREFHDWQQYTCWARVEKMFTEKKNWGVLNFGRKNHFALLQEVRPEKLYPGENEVSGEYLGIAPRKVAFLNEKGKVLGGAEVDENNRRFRFLCNIDDAVQTRAYTLAVMDKAGKILEKKSSLLVPEEQGVQFFPDSVDCFSGGTFSAVVKMNISLRSLQQGIAFRLCREDGRALRRFQAGPRENSFRIWLKTNGLKPGSYWLEPEFPRNSAVRFRKGGRLRLRVYPYMF